MINWRLYRAGFVPFLIAIAIAAFSLHPRPQQLTSTLAPDAFQGQRAFAELQSLAARFPQRRPGSRGDDQLAAYVAGTLKGLGGTAGGGFSVRTITSAGQTIDGERELTNVIAQRPGSTGASPILIVAHRDAAAPPAEAELSGTATLLELARVFASRETKRTIVLASTSGGSGGDAGVRALVSELHGPFDAAIALGDVASADARSPMVIPYSDAMGSAPLQLQRTVSSAITTQAGIDPGSPSVLGQLAHLAFPLAIGEQGVLDAEGIPAVTVQVSGEGGPAHSGARAHVSAERVEGLGRGTLNALDALDAAPDVSHEAQTGLLLSNQTMPAWVLRLLVLTLVVPVLVAVADGFARLRRRRLPVGRWTLWTLSCSLPFLACALLALLLGGLGILGVAPSVPATPGALAFDLTAATAVAALVLTFALTWGLWGALVRRLGWEVRPDAEVAGVSMLLVATPIVLIAWIRNPYAALLALPALHAWLVLASPPRSQEGRPLRRSAALGLVVVGLLPLALLVLFYAHQLGLGVGELAWASVLLVAGGQMGLGAAILWSLALGCASAAAVLAVMPQRPPPGLEFSDGFEVTIRGPMSYAGPGSLGGTESALRR